METTDFIFPVGLLKADLFPGYTLETLVAAWLVEAGSKASTADTLDQQNEATEAWVYYRAYYDIWQRLSSSPSSLSLDGTSYGMGQEQIGAYRSLWTRYKGEFDEVMGIGLQVPFRTKAIKAVASW